MLLSLGSENAGNQSFPIWGQREAGQVLSLNFTIHEHTNLPARVVIIQIVKTLEYLNSMIHPIRD